MIVLWIDQNVIQQQDKLNKYFFFHVGSFGEKMESTCENYNLIVKFLYLRLGERSVCYNVFVLAKPGAFFFLILRECSVVLN